jgi:hypothetical protein
MLRAKEKELLLRVTEEADFEQIQAIKRNLNKTGLRRERSLQVRTFVLD